MKHITFIAPLCLAAAVSITALPARDRSDQGQNGPVKAQNNRDQIRSNPAASKDGAGSPQAHLTLEQCYRASERNYPIVRKYDLIGKTRDYTVSNAAKSYLPQVTLSARASWQSDVTKFSIDGEKLASGSFGSLVGAQELSELIPHISKDQYVASLDISQTIWDGGAAKARKELAEKEAEVESGSVSASIYSLRERINELYFGILLLQSNIELNNLMLSSLNASYDKVSSYLSGGVAGQADLDAIKIRILKTGQETLNLENTNAAYCKMLSLITGLSVDGSSILEKPAELAVSGIGIRRPELELFDAQTARIASQNRMLNAGLTPKFGLYVTGGYGRPGLNMLSDSFRPFVTAGVRLSWNIGNFYNIRNDRRLLGAKAAMTEADRAAFLLNADIDTSRGESEISTLRGQLASDDEIIRLHKEVLKANEAKMAEGTISGTDLVGYMNDVLMAAQSKVRHETEMLLAMYNLAFVRGEGD